MHHSVTSQRLTVPRLATFAQLALFQPEQTGILAGEPERQYPPVLILNGRCRALRVSSLIFSDSCFSRRLSRVGRLARREHRNDQPESVAWSATDADTNTSYAAFTTFTSSTATDTDADAHAFGSTDDGETRWNGDTYLELNKRNVVDD